MVTRRRVARHWLAEWTVTGLLLLFGAATPVQAFVVPIASMDTMIKLIYASANDFSRAPRPYSDGKRGDVIVFRHPLDEAQPYVKRVMGVPGDRIRFADNRASLSGLLVDEPYKRQKPALRVPYLRNLPNEPAFAGIESRALEMFHPGGRQPGQLSRVAFLGVCATRKHLWQAGSGVVVVRGFLGSNQRCSPTFFHEDSLGANISANHFVSTRIAHGKD